FAVIKVFPKTVSDLNSLEKIRRNIRDVDFWSEPNKLLSPLLFNVSPHSKNATLNLLNEAKLNFTTETEDFGEWVKADHQYAFQSMAEDVNFDSIDFERYYPYDKIVQILKHFERKYPSTAKYFSLGTTFENNDIPILVVDSNANYRKAAIVFECGIHAREWIAPASCLWFINELLTTDKGKKLLDAHSFHFVVTLNPDGYIHSWTTNRVWRKNRSPNNVENIWFDCSGVDLNRNFDARFKKDISYKANNYCSETYHGTSAFSEKETQAMSNYVLEVSKKSGIDIYFSIHSFAQLLLHPYGYAKNVPIISDDYKTMAKSFANAVYNTFGEVYRTGSIKGILYSAYGNSIDWVEENKLSKFSVCIELRDKGTHGFRLPPYLIKPTSIEVWNGINAMLE
ncbi:hypothetical protein B4U80_04578, partial [Leptotrombidium deliense]